MDGKDGWTKISDLLSEDGIGMKRRVLAYFLSAASVFLTMSYMINAFRALFASFGFTII